VHCCIITTFTPCKSLWSRLSRWQNRRLSRFFFRTAANSAAYRSHQQDAGIRNDVFVRLSSEWMTEGLSIYIFTYLFLNPFRLHIHKPKIHVRFKKGFKMTLCRPEEHEHSILAFIEYLYLLGSVAFPSAAAPKARRHTGLRTCLKLDSVQHWVCKRNFNILTRTYIHRHTYRVYIMTEIGCTMLPDKTLPCVRPSYSFWF